MVAERTRRGSVGTPGWALLLVAVAVVASACDAGGPRYEVRARLLEHVRGADDQRGSNCPVADERRPALGCTRWTLRSLGKVERTGRQPILRFKASARERRQAAGFKGEWRRPGPGGSREGPHTPQLAFDGPMATAALPDFPADAPPGTAVSVWSRSLPARVHRTGPVAIGPRDVLAVGLAVDPDLPPVGVAAVDFLIEADAGAGWRELLRETLPAGEPGSGRWADRRVPLGAVESPATRFRFTTRPRRGAGAAAARPVVGPLWGAPEVLAPVGGDDHRPNVVLVSLDTLRADHVGARRGGAPLTPRLDALAAEGTVFETASTTFPSTTGAHLSMFTGLYPARLEIFDPSRRMRSSVRTLAQMFATAGWRTKAVTEAGMLAAAVGFDRGFSRYWENAAIESRTEPSDKAALTFDAAIARLAERPDERVFLFVHTYAVHFPYTAPAEYRPDTWLDEGVERPIADAPPGRDLPNRYAGDVRYADEQVGRLVDAIRDLGLARNTVLVVTSDHGEEFFEHGGWGHALTMYEEVMRVPIVVWGPGRVPAGRRVRTPVSLVDLPPTILELAGVRPPAGLDGESQVGRMRGETADDPDRVVFGEVAHVENVHARQYVGRSGTTKWILTESTPPRLVAYDLVADPTEQHPLDDPALLARGRALLAGYRALGSEAAPTTPVPVDEDTREQLRALGYLE